MLRNRKFKDYTGSVFGRLTVISMFRHPDNQRLYCHCLCKCGNYTDVRIDQLKSGSVTSCNCYRIEQVKKGNIKHDKSHSKLYKAYTGLKQRCTNPNNTAFKHYGAKGIKISEEFNTFEKFYNWSMNNGYKEGYDIHRLDSNKDYTPLNCKWISHEEHMKIHGKEHGKAIVKIDPITGEIIEKYVSVSAGIKKNGAHIKEALNNPNLIRYGYKWKYENEEFNQPKQIMKSETPLYKIYIRIKQYCYNKNNISYKKIGARGIILEQDFATYELFEQWALNNGYKDGLCINRIDENKNFCASNCEWIDKKIRMRTVAQNRWRKIAKIDPNTNEVLEIFDTVTEAKQKTHSRIDRALKDPNKILAGFKWQYID